MGSKTIPPTKVSPKLHHHLASKEKQDFFRELQNLTLARPAMTQVSRNKTTWLHAPNLDGRCRKLHQPQIHQVANTELHHVYCFFSFLIFAFALRIACSAKPLLCESSAVFVLWNFDTMLLCQPSCNLRCPHLHRRAIVRPPNHDLVNRQRQPVHECLDWQICVTLLFGTAAANNHLCF